MTQEEWADRKKEVVYINNEVKGDDQLIPFLCREQENNNFYNMPQYKFILLPDFDSEKSIIVMKAHHSFTDGLGIACLFASIGQEYDSTTLPGMKPVPWIKRFFIFLMSPFLVLYVLLKVQLTPDDNNSMKNSEPKTGRKTGAYSKDLDLPAMKKYCKANGITINDYTTSLLSISLREYFNKEKERTNALGLSKVYEVPDAINVGLPFSMRQPVKLLKDLKMVNDFSSVPIRLELCKEFDDALRRVKAQFGALKHSLLPFGCVYASIVSVSLPFTLPRFTLGDITNKYTLIYSNLNASRKSYLWDGKHSIGQFFFVPGLANLYTGIGIMTVEDIMSIAIFSDEAYLHDPKSFI